MKPFTLSIFLWLCGFSLQAQQTTSISGKAVNEQGKALAGATVFIDGSEKGTSTDKEGRFYFHQIEPGTYHVVVKMLGYLSLKQNVIVQQSPIELTLQLQEKPIMLAEVRIGNNEARAAYLKLFIENFLGQSANAKNCKILNTDIINFTNSGGSPQLKTDQFNLTGYAGVLQAESDDFLVIENKSLGYRIKYLLRTFKHNRATKVTSYDGEYIFEPMVDSAKEQEKWAANRLRTYQGSIMHYLRALYQNQTEKAGFAIYQLRETRQSYNGRPIAEFDSRPLNMWDYTRQVDKDFIALQFPGQWMILFKNNGHQKTLQSVKDSASSKEYFKKEERQKPFHSLKDSVTSKEIPKKTSFLKLYLDEAIIDSKGKIIDYRSFLQQGYWGTMRIADQLPFEYEPPQ